MLDFSRLRAPPEHGDVLIEPSPDRMAALAQENHASLRDLRLQVLDTDVNDVRAFLRGTMCDGYDGPLVLIGHQPEFIHAGVWAKHVVAANVAASMGARAVNLIVDNDAPSAVLLDVPHAVGARVKTRSIPFGQLAHGSALEGAPPADQHTRRRFDAAVREIMGERFERSSMPRYLSALAKSDAAADRVDQMVLARRAVDRSFGIELMDRRISDTWVGPFLADLMLNADRFAGCYNAALAAYRIAQKVRNDHRPIPDLAREASRTELPVWVYRLREPRRRLYVERRADAIALYAGTERFGGISTSDLGRWDRAEVALKNQSGYLFRPRALSLTLWARVFVGDLFIHGIGGAKYDRITDDLMRRYYGIEPPAMACVSATMLMNLPHDNVNPSTLRQARARSRDIQYNPQRHIHRTPAVADLLDERAAAVAESINLKARGVRNRRDRRAVFGRIRSANDRLNAAEPAMATEAEEAIARIKGRLADHQASTRRDYFFALLDRTDVERLRDRLAHGAPFRV